MKTHIKALTITLSVLCFILGIYFYFAGVRQIENTDVPIIKDTSKLELPKVDLQSFMGAKVNLKDFAGKVIIFNFWASWCSPCIEEVPSLVSLVKADPNIIIIAVSGDQSKDDVIAFLKSFPDFNKPPIYVVLENSKALVEQFKVDKLPESFIFNPKGEMVKKISGTINWHTSESLEYFRMLKSQ